MYRSFLTLFILFLFHLSLLAQSKYNFETAKDDLNKIINVPSEWESKEALLLLGTAALTFGSMYIDSDIRKIVLDNNAYSQSLPIEFGRIWGEPWLTGTVGLGLYLIGSSQKNVKNKKIGFEILESALFSSLITGLIKISFGRERPLINSDPFKFHPFSLKGYDFMSLSSGHTALAFSISTILAKNTNNDLLKSVYYLPALLTGVSRVYQNQHWFSDVVLGGIIGYSMAQLIFSWHEKNQKNIHQANPLNKSESLIKFEFSLN